VLTMVLQCEERIQQERGGRWPPKEDGLLPLSGPPQPQDENASPAAVSLAIRTGRSMLSPGVDWASVAGATTGDVAVATVGGVTADPEGIEAAAAHREAEPHGLANQRRQVGGVLPRGCSWPT
jgi:hypothetical protein